MKRIKFSRSHFRNSPMGGERFGYNLQLEPMVSMYSSSSLPTGGRKVNIVVVIVDDDDGN